MKRKRIIVLLLIIVITCSIVGCEKQNSKLETSKEDNKPELKAKLVDKEIKEYIEKARNNEKDMDKLYREIVCEPIWKEVHRNEYSFGWASFYFNTIRKLDLLENEIDILVKEDVVNIVEDILEECNKFLPAANTTVYIFPHDPTDRAFKYRCSGVGGFAMAVGGEEIFLFVNPTQGGWKERIKYIVAHEYHHTRWRYKDYRGYSLTLLDHLIMEGEADSFANIVYPEVGVPFYTSVFSFPPSREKELWEKIKPNLDSTDQNYYGKVFLKGYYGKDFFEDDEEFPTLTGYQIGYNIVQNFIKNNPRVSIDEWTNMDAKEVLERSGYEEDLEKKSEKYNND